MQRKNRWWRTGARCSIAGCLGWPTRKFPTKNFSKSWIFSNRQFWTSLRCINPRSWSLGLVNGNNFSKAHENSRKKLRAVRMCTSLPQVVLRIFFLKILVMRANFCEIWWFWYRLQNFGKILSRLYAHTGTNFSKFWLSNFVKIAKLW